MMGISSHVEVNRHTDGLIQGFDCEHRERDPIFNFFRSKRPVSPAPNVYLTKTDYIAGLQCPLRLWMRRHEPLPKEARIETAAMRTGNRVGRGAPMPFFQAASWSMRWIMQRLSIKLVISWRTT
jgi:hypothetical protein